MENEELKTLEEAPPRVKECELEKASMLYKAKTGVGCDGFHPKVPLDLTKQTRGENRGLLGDGGTKWKMAVKNVTSERPIALMPTLIRWWEALRAPEVVGRH